MPSSSAALWRLRLFVLLGSVLLFGLEPLVGRLILPSFGAAFDVWATCLMFFQGALFAGYLYCHLLVARLGRWHLLVMCLPLLLLPLAGAPAPPDPAAPAASLLGHLGAWILLPFGVLATTGVVAQRWLATSSLPGRDDPYVLYAASNLGSILGLLGYPLLVEPLLSLDTQRYAWSAAFVLYLALAFFTAPRPGAGAAASPEVEAPPREAPPEPAAVPPGGAATPRRVAYWFLLSMGPSAFLVAVTNALALDVGSVPLVWVVPLCLYLLSFILVFGRRQRYPRLLRRFWPELVVVALWFHTTTDAGVHLGTAALHLVTLLAVCLAAHAALHQARPHPRHLTTFYLVVSLGGWAGGVFVSLVAPRVFTTLAEYPLALVLIAATVLVGRFRDLLTFLRETPLPVLFASTLLVSAIAVDTLERRLYATTSGYAPRTVAVVRNFYGIYKITDTPSPAPLPLEERRRRGVRRLYHGTTLHGKQLRHHPTARLHPLGYYHPRSPLGDLMQVTEAPRRVAVIGLGAGAAAAHLGPGDSVTFYELDPDVIALARSYFSYLDDTRAEVRTVAGDARLGLATDPGASPGGFDVILVDAFSSDAIPIHLLTREALELYASRLAPEGWLIFHISNRYYDLRPVLRATSAGLLEGAFKARDPDVVDAEDDFEDPAEYYALRRPGLPLEPLLERGWTLAEGADLPELTPWTDDYANVLAPLAAQWLPELVE